MNSTKTFSQATTSEAGFYETVQDYYDNKIKNVGEFGASDINKVIFTKDGKKTVYASRDLKDWGFKDGRGYIWRVYNKQNYGIIEKGKIIVYAKCFLEQNKKNTNEIKVDAELIYMSNGYDGELFCFATDKKETLKNIADWMRKYNPALAAKFESESYGLFPNNVKKAVEQIQQFNDEVAGIKADRYELNIKVMK